MVLLATALVQGQALALLASAACAPGRTFHGRCYDVDNLLRKMCKKDGCEPSLPCLSNSRSMAHLPVRELKGSLSKVYDVLCVAA